MASLIMSSVFLAVLCLFQADVSEAVECYSCNRISITNYNGADQTNTDAAMSSVLMTGGLNVDDNCKDGLLSVSQQTTCPDGQACYVMSATFNIDFNTDQGTTTLDAEGDIRYCLLATERLPDIEYGCEDESHAEFLDAAGNSIELLASQGSPFSNTANYDGNICKCTTDKCNGNAASAGGNTEYDENAGGDSDNDNDNGGASCLQIHMVYILIIVAFLQLMYL